jgi:diguanylate cyclase (GGDEF)-like protein/PAS domain S-box-containing protein
MRYKKFDANILEQLINTSPAAMFIVDKDRNMLFANKSYAKMFGYTQEEVVNVNARMFHISDENYERFGQIAFEAVKQGKPVSTDFEAKKKDGTHIWVHVVGSLVKNQELILWTMIDITSRVKAEKKIEEANYNLQQYLNAIDKIELGLFVVDEDYIVRYMNETMKKWFGNQIGKICYSSVANLNEPCPYCKLKEVIIDGKKVKYDPTTPDGRTFDIVATPIKNSNGTISKMEIIRDITAIKKAQLELIKQKEKLYYQANHDSLTGLPNRILFQDRLGHAIEKAKRANSKVALLFIDLDHFKEINDSLGHDIGDEVLKDIAKKLKSILREEDTLSRLGGDEFTIIIEDFKNEKDLSYIASKVIQTLSEDINIKNNKLYVTTSIGISIFPDDGDDATNLLKYADSAMYKAKHEGRNRFEFYSYEMTELALEKITLQSDLISALKNDEILIYYQPQINAITSKIIGMEALSRWKHSKIGFIPPSKFIPLAESSGLIIELDKYVMKKAMQQFSKWYSLGYSPGILALNLSVKLLQNENFLDFLKETIKLYNFKPTWLELEITESQIMTKPKEAIKVLNKINELGIKIAIDDFGTGYSSLSYLKKLPIDKLKIDQSFTKDLPEDEEDSAITKAIIALGKSLNLELIAEGVETKEQKDFMILNGCENIQGFLFSKPLSSKNIEKFLK